MAEEKKRGGWRAGAGRPKIEGTRHTWVVPDDIEQVVKQYGIPYVWEAVRFKLKFDAIQINE